jgi:hypothetical protein
VFFWATTIGFADIRITRAQSLVDDYIDILLYYASFRVRIKAGFCAKANPMSFTEKRFVFKARGDVQEDELKLGKTKFRYLGNRIHYQTRTVTHRNKW